MNTNDIIRMKVENAESLKSNELPLEIWLMILGYLEMRDYTLTARVNRMLLQASLKLLYERPCFDRMDGERLRRTRYKSETWELPIGNDQTPPCAPPNSPEDPRGFWECLVETFSWRRWRMKKISSTADKWKCFLQSLGRTFDTNDSVQLQILESLTSYHYFRQCRDQGKLFGISLGSLVRNLDMKSLVGDNVYVDDRDLEIIALTCSKLSRLNMEGCIGVTDYGISLFGMNCMENVTSLSLADCYMLGDSSLKSLGKNCKMLRSLNLRGLLEITDLGLTSVIKQSKQLTRLRISSCVKISNGNLMERCN